MGFEDGTARRRQLAPSADDIAVDRVIDLAALERAREARTRSGHGDPDTWTVDFDSSSVEPVAVDHRRVERVSRRLKVVTTLSVIAVLVLAAVTTVSYRRGTTWRAIAVEQRARGEQLEDRIVAAQEAVEDSEAVVQRAMEARAVAEAARDATSGRLTTSEEDVAALEERIAQLAGEKARLEDEVAVADQAVRTDAGTLAAMRQCISAIDAWLERAPTDGQVPSWELWTGESAQWESGCDAVMEATAPPQSR